MTAFRTASCLLLCLVSYIPIARGQDIAALLGPNKETPLAEEHQRPLEEEPSSPLMPPPLPGKPIELEGVVLRINGYLRPMIFAETQEFGDLGLESRERFTAIGVRTKLRMEGRMEDKARFYSEYILDFNEVDQGTSTASGESESGRIKNIKTYF